MAKILIGLLKYEEGDILFDEEPLKKFSLESLYEKISYLSQDTSVFDGTIRENLVFDKEVSDTDIHVSLAGTQLLSMIASLDKGVDTRIGEKGTCLSGGEKHRHEKCFKTGESCHSDCYFLELYRKEKRLE